MWKDRKQEQRRRAISRGFCIVRGAGDGAEYVGRLNLAGAHRVEKNGCLHPRDIPEILESLPLYAWMTLEITPLAAHPNDPGSSP